MTIGLQTQQCVATSRRTGERCRSRALRGTTVCRMHGGAAKQVQRRAQERIALAEALQMSPGRHPGEVLLSAVHGLDVLVEDARKIVIESDSPTAAQISTLADRLAQAGRYAKMALDANAQAMLNQREQVEGARIATIVNQAIGEAQLCYECEGRLRPALRAVLERDAAGFDVRTPSSSANRPSRMDASIVISGDVVDE